MWKVEYIQGATWFVQKELTLKGLSSGIISADEQYTYLTKASISLDQLKSLQTVTKVYSVVQHSDYSPKYLSKHKSIIRKALFVLNETMDDFESFQIKCAGDDTPEVQSIIRYLSQELAIPHDINSPDLKIQIIKQNDNLWELTIQLTHRPLSAREYKVSHLSGALNPTIAHGMNLLAGVDSQASVLNPCCGSATLLIEALHCNPNIKTAIGFDIEREALSASLDNIKQAGLIRKIKIQTLDIMEALPPHIANQKFEAIVSDLPFGMAISKYLDLESLYTRYIEIAERCLTPNGALVTITSQDHLFQDIIKHSTLRIAKQIPLRQMTTAGEYLETTVFLCRK